VKRLAAATCVALLLVAGCETVRSKDVRSSGIKASILVRVTRRGTDVTVTLTAGGLTSIALDPGDSLTASGGGRMVSLNRTHFAGASAYFATLVGVTKPGVQITVALNRTASDTDAPHSTVRLPGPITASIPARTFSRAADKVPLRLNGDVGQVRVDWQGPCAFQDSIGVLVDGPQYAIPAGTFHSYGTGPKAPSPRCDLRITVWRIEKGKLDKALKGGFIQAERSATAVLHSVP
jgi:hypothetical protein